MMLQKTFLVFVILFASFEFCFGQEESKSELIQELGSLGGCENYRSSLDFLFAELLEEPESVGYVIIQGNQDIAIQTIIYKEWAHNHLKFRKFEERMKTFNESRLLVVRGNDSPELKVQLWKVPNNTEKPFKFDANFDYSLKLEKPLILFDSNFDGGGLCPAINYEKIYLESLKNNPDLNGNIVFYENSKSKFLSMKKDFLKENNSVSQNRLRFFHAPKIYDGWESYYEFWLVPQKKK